MMQTEVSYDVDHKAAASAMFNELLAFFRTDPEYNSANAKQIDALRKTMNDYMLAMSRELTAQLRPASMNLSEPPIRFQVGYHA